MVTDVATDGWARDARLREHRLEGQGQHFIVPEASQTPLLFDWAMYITVAAQAHTAIEPKTAEGRPHLGRRHETRLHSARMRGASPNCT